MARNPDNIRSKIQIPAGITPINDNSEYPSHYSDFGFGGLRTVDTIMQRDEIPALRRVRGMQVYVIANKSYYRLEDGITNTNWTLVPLDDLTTAINLGTDTDGDGLFTSKQGDELQFKRIKAGDGVSLTSETNDIVITSTNTSGHVIEKENGSALPQRGNLQFIGAGTVTDDILANDRTIVSLDGTKLLERQFVAADWKTTDAPAGSIVLNINHNLNTGNIIVEWYENTSQGAVFVPWESRDNNNIRGCIPAGSGFTGLARIASSSILTQEQGSGVRGFETSFNNLTSGNDASWTETGTDTGIFELDISHGLNSTVVDYLLYLDNRCPVLICPTAITTTRITFQVPQATVFGGRIFVTKIGE